MSEAVGLGFLLGSFSTLAASCMSIPCRELVTSVEQIISVERHGPAPLAANMQLGSLL